MVGGGIHEDRLRAALNGVAAAYPSRSELIEKKREGALGTKVRGCSFFEGDASHTAQARPLGSRIEETEAPEATSVFDGDVKLNWKPRKSQRVESDSVIVPFYILCMKSLDGLYGHLKRGGSVLCNSSWTHSLPSPVSSQD
jgi:hypothetical protein